IIENCLFGVDINSKAVYICQLRLWIELLKNAYYKNGVMETLPNIDINIKVGSSPLSKIDFIIGKKIKTDKDTGKLIQDYKTLVSQYKSVSDKIKKKELQKKLFETKEQVHGLYEQFSFFKEHDTTYDCAFEWAFEFPEILDENGKFIGFDAVIGNPPYIQLQTMHEEADKLQKMSYQTYARTGDIYCLFYELAYRLLKTDGILAFVTSNKWMRAGYGEALRKFLCEKTNPTHLIDFAGQKVFDSATVDVNILIYRKSKNQHKTLSCVIKDADWRNNLSDYFQQNAEENRFDNFASWVILSPIEQSIKRKIETVGTPLKDWNIKIYRGILTGYNDAFIIDGRKKDELIAADPKSAEIIRPILRGRDIKRYSYSFGNQYIISLFPSLNYDIDNYPAVKSYLLSFGKERLEQTGKTYIINNERVQSRKKTNNKWFETQDSINYSDDFSKQKIVWKRVGSLTRFCYDESGCFCLDSTCFAIGKNLKFLTLLLNSPLGKYLLKDSPKTGTGDLLISVQAIEPIKVPKISNDENKEYERLFDILIQLLNQNQSEQVEQLCSTINNNLFKLYNLTQAEIGFISSF
ncbi:MAG: Eco57I restriction-modification methylase domain-containing protein, partial [Muribaculaceae bacterium]|nr:Eco57I restriction-modification methylase domain-containing protein [Muribaculaceae bacterium]